MEGSCPPHPRLCRCSGAGWPGGTGVVPAPTWGGTGLGDTQGGGALFWGHFPAYWVIYPPGEPGVWEQGVGLGGQKAEPRGETSGSPRAAWDRLCPPFPRACATSLSTQRGPSPSPRATPVTPRHPGEQQRSPWGGGAPPPRQTPASTPCSAAIPVHPLPVPRHPLSPYTHYLSPGTHSLSPYTHCPHVPTACPQAPTACPYAPTVPI